MVSDEKSQTPSARGDQENSGVSDDTHSVGGISTVSPRDGNVNVGTCRTDWPWKDSSLGILLGGILEQLLESHRQRLNETRECVEWYLREEKKTLDQIQKLEQLQEMASSWNAQDDEPEEQNVTNEEE